jgi:hypothetical protein
LKNNQNGDDIPNIADVDFFDFTARDLVGFPLTDFQTRRSFKTLLGFLLDFTIFQDGVISILPV